MKWFLMGLMALFLSGMMHLRWRRSIRNLDTSGEGWWKAGLFFAYFAAFFALVAVLSHEQKAREDGIKAPVQQIQMNG